MGNRMVYIVPQYYYHIRCYDHFLFVEKARTGKKYVSQEKQNTKKTFSNGQT